MVLNYNLVVCSWLTLITGLTSKLQVFVKPVFQLSLPLQLNVCLNVCVKAFKWHISRPTTKARRSEHSATFISNWSCFKLIMFTTDKRWLLPLSFLILFSSSFPKSANLPSFPMPAPHKHYGVFDVFADFQSFFQPENLGFALSNVHRWQISTSR